MAGGDQHPADVRQEQELRERVRRHRICWHTWPEHRVRGSERRQIGFRLGLLGSHDRPGTPPVTSSAESWQLYRSLQDLARWILPQAGEESNESDVQISVSGASLAAKEGRQDIVLTIEITCRQGFEHPVDAQELRCLAEIDEIEEKLLRLGAPQERWQ